MNIIEPHLVLTLRCAPIPAGCRSRGKSSCSQAVLLPPTFSTCNDPSTHPTTSPPLAASPAPVAETDPSAPRPPSLPLEGPDSPGRLRQSRKRTTAPTRDVPFTAQRRSPPNRIWLVRFQVEQGRVRVRLFSDGFGNLRPSFLGGLITAMKRPVVRVPQSVRGRYPKKSQCTISQTRVMGLPYIHDYIDSPNHCNVII